MQHITAMEELKSLSVTFGPGILADPRACTLPPSLTTLAVDLVASPEPPSEPCPRFLATVPQLNNLQELQLYPCTFSPQDMADLTQLVSLRLDYCNLLPRDPDDVEPGSGYDCAGTIALMSALLKLHELQSIVLNLPTLDTYVGRTLGVAQHCSALTTSPCLTSLRTNPGYEVRPLPIFAVQHMFPRGKTSPLKELELGSLVSNDLSLLNSASGLCPFVDDDLDNIVAACTGLTTLSLVSSIYGHFELPALRKLPSTTVELSLGGKVCRDKAAALVAELTQLTSLEWLCAPEFTDEGLQKFTALTSLDRLWVAMCPGISKRVCEGDELKLHSDDTKVRITL